MSRTGKTKRYCFLGKYQSSAKFSTKQKMSTAGKSVNDQYPSRVNSKEVVQLSYSLTSKMGSN